MMRQDKRERVEKGIIEKVRGKDKTADIYNTIYKEIYKDQGFCYPVKFNKLLLKLLEVKRGKKLLDVGCGEGFLVKEAENFGLDIYGIDISREIIKLAKKHCKAELKVANGEQIPYGDNKFDYVTSIGCLEHYNDMERGIREIARVLKRDGKALIYVPNTFYIRDILSVLFRGEIIKTLQPINKTQTFWQWKRVIEKNGLKVIKTHYYNIGEGHRLKSDNFLKFIKKLVYFSFQWMIPKNFCYHFAFVCRKKDIEEEKSYNEN